MSQPFFWPPPFPLVYNLYVFDRDDRCSAKKLKVIKVQTAIDNPVAIVICAQITQTI